MQFPRPRWRWSLWALPFFALVAALATASQATGGFWETFGPDIAVDLAGIFLAVVVIEALIRRDRLRALAGPRVIAKRRVASALTRLLFLLACMYRASAPTSGTQFRSGRHVVLQGWLPNVPYLDFDTASPHGDRWSEHLINAVREINEDLRDVRDRLHEVLDAEEFIAIEDFLDDPVWLLLEQTERIRGSAIARGTFAPPYRFLGDDGEQADEARTEFANRTFALMKLYQRMFGEEILVPDQAYEGTAWGHGRSEALGYGPEFVGPLQGLEHAAP
jgi:hypothetical protein